MAGGTRRAYIDWARGLAVLIMIGALFNRMAPVLWVIAVLSNWTVVHRMIYTWQEATRLEDAQLRSVKEPIES